MGSMTFYFEITTHDLKSAFDERVKEEKETYGHRRGYGFNKNSFEMINLPSNINTERKIEQYIHNLFNNENHLCNDKWTYRACCVKLPKKSKVEVLEVCGTTVETLKSSKVKKVWKTKFLIKDLNGNLISEKLTKALALSFAKDYSLKNKKELIVEEAKVLVSGSPILNKIVPKYKKVKKDSYKYIIFGTHPD